MRVYELMHKAFVCSANLSICDIASFMADKGVDSVLVNNDNVIGIITERDILKKVVAKRKNPSTVLGRQIMSLPLITIDSFLDVEDASLMLQSNNVRRLVVLENASIAGIISSEQIAKNVRYLTARRLSVRESLSMARFSH